ncbi:MAG: 5'/3'-nucleotidase SurE [Nitrospinae bacterium RIFCSPLOWO2_12_FULL_45_22]|nr:MAG: 5'/3'-nucleotidase SurE [Nitrospinae bacterium RIFCSPLOWO2_12_FULL_45_22]
MIILISNDDGIYSPGLRALYDSLVGLGEIYVLAPDRNRSAASHSVTLYSPLRVKEVEDHWYMVDGTPSDCINLGVNGILRDKKPNLIAVGINEGGNLGDDITYSGTVMAAIEGNLLGIPSIAVSLVTRNNFQFQVAAAFSQKLCQYILEKGLPLNTILNVNVPNVAREEMKGVLITRQGKRRYSGAVIEKVDPRGQKYYWLGGGEDGWYGEEGTDFHAINTGNISISPLHIDLTNYSAYKDLLDWGIEF